MVRGTNAKSSAVSGAEKEQTGSITPQSSCNTKSSSVSGAEKLQTRSNTPLTRSATVGACRQAKSTSPPNVCMDVNMEALEKRLILNINKLLTEVKNELSDKIDQVVAALRNEIDSVRCTNESLSHRVASLEVEINELHRTHRLNDIVIRGIPVQRRENTCDLFSKVAATIKHSATPFIDAFRLKSAGSSGSAPIIVRFSSQNEKRAFFKALKIHGPLLLNQIGVGFSSESPIYFNDSLSRYNQTILSEARRMRSQNKLHSVSSRNGFVCVRKKNGDLPTRILNLEELHALDRSGSVPTPGS